MNARPAGHSTHSRVGSIAETYVGNTDFNAGKRVRLVFDAFAQHHETDLFGNTDHGAFLQVEDARRLLIQSGPLLTLGTVCREDKTIDLLIAGGRVDAL